MFDAPFQLYATVGYNCSAVELSTSTLINRVESTCIELFHYDSMCLHDDGISGVARILVWGGQCIHCFI